MGDVTCLLSLPCHGLGTGKQGSDEAHLTPLAPSAELLGAGLPRIPWARPSLTVRPNALPSSMALPLSLPTRFSSRFIPPRALGRMEVSGEATPRAAVLAQRHLPANSSGVSCVPWTPQMLVQGPVREPAPRAPEPLTPSRSLPSAPRVSRTHGSSPRSNCVITPGLGPAGPAPGKQMGPGVGAKDMGLGAGRGRGRADAGVMGSQNTLGG